MRPSAAQSCGGRGLGGAGLEHPDLPYRNRSEAGRLLAAALAHYKSKPDVIVLGLTRGGVTVAAELAMVAIGGATPKRSPDRSRRPSIANARKWNAANSFTALAGPPLDLKARAAIIVDDGLATGSTTFAAVGFARGNAWRERTVMAVPVTSVEACENLRVNVDESVCLATPDPFFDMGDWYLNFLPTSDGEVLNLLEENAKRSRDSGLMGRAQTR